MSRVDGFPKELLVVFFNVINLKYALYVSKYKLLYQLDFKVDFERKYFCGKRYYWFKKQQLHH